MIDVKRIREFAERDGVHAISKETLLILLDRLEAAEQREQALAAHVTRLRELIDQAAEGTIAPQDIAVILVREEKQHES